MCIVRNLENCSPGIMLLLLKIMPSLLAMTQTNGTGCNYKLDIKTCL